MLEQSGILTASPSPQQHGFAPIIFCKLTQEVTNVGDTCQKCNIGKFVSKSFKGDDFVTCNNYPACKNMIKIKTK